MKYLYLLLCLATLELQAYGGNKKMCLGLKTQPLPEWAAEQLGLRYGEGLLIQHILDNSPAHKAGLQNNDILLKADEQTIGTPGHLRELICDKESLDKITVSILRQGKPLNIEITLEHSAFDIKDTPKLNLATNESSQKRPNLNAHSQGVPQQQLRQQMRQQMQAFQNQIDHFFDQESDLSFADLKKQMHQDFEKFKAGKNKKMVGDFQSSQSSSFQFMDAQGVVKIQTNNDKQTIIICDLKNNILYQGPYPKNQENWNNMDESAKERLLKLDLEINPETGLVTAQLFN